MRLISKGVLGATMALAAGSAAAQSSVTLYGVVDVFGQYLNSGAGTKSGPGSAYVPGAASFSERSGGSAGSQFGLKGTEDLGGGLKAAFDVETGFNANNGAFFADTTALFYRQAWVGLKHDDYGQLTFGRQYQPTFWAVYPTDPFRGNEVMSPLAAADLAGARDRATLATQYVSGRQSNSVLYISPELYGLKLYAMYAFPATITQPVQSTSGIMYDIALTFQGAGLYAALAYQFQHGGQETAALGTTPAGAPLPASTFNLVSTEHYTAALGYRFGIVNLQFNYAYNKVKSPSSGQIVTVPGVGPVGALSSLVHPFSIIELGTTIQATSADVIEVAGIYRNVRGVDDNTLGIQVGADHSLSKRTSVYVRAGYMKNNGIANMSWPGMTAADGSKQILGVAGITHRF